MSADREKVHFLCGFPAVCRGVGTVKWDGAEFARVVGPFRTPTSVASVSFSKSTETASLAKDLAPRSSLHQREHVRIICRAVLS